MEGIDIKKMEADFMGDDGAYCLGFTYFCITFAHSGSEMCSSIHICVQVSLFLREHIMIACKRITPFIALIFAACFRQL